MITAGIHGFILALGLILPLGVQNVFVFNQGVTQRKFKHVLPVIVTATLCDSILITAAVLGISLIVLSITWFKTLLFGIGILFLLYMGYATWKSDSGTSEARKAEPLPAKKQILFAMSVSFLNPHAILDIIGVIGTSSLAYESIEKLVFAIVCMLVSLLWFTGLGIAGRAIGSLDGKGYIITLFNKLSALIMWGTAVYLAISL